MEVSFINPIYLWTLLVIPILVALYFLSVKYSKAMTLKFANFVALSRISGGVKETPNIAVLVVRMVALILVILSISGMTLWYVGDSPNKDYVIAIDSSSSMVQEDFFPSRLEAAKTAAINFVDDLPLNSKIGVLNFAGVSFVDQPLTQQKSLVKEAIANINSKTVGGTDIGSAVITGANILMPSNKAKIIILLTDGRSNIGVADETAIGYAISTHVVVHTIGIGSVKEGEEEFGLGVDEQSLKNLADLTLGSYYLAENSEDLMNVYDEIIQSRNYGKIPVNLSFSFLIVSLILLLSDWLLGNTIYRIIPGFL